MDYEEYKKKVEKVKEVVETLNEVNDSTIARDTSLKLQNIFPEICESEDENIRTGLINGFKECLKDLQYPKNAQKYWHNIKIEDILTWLEKQANKDKLIKELGKYKVKYTQEVLSQQLEKQSEWSEEDEKNLNDLDVILFEYKDMPKENYWHIINWAKSLKQRMEDFVNSPEVKAVDLEKEINSWMEDNTCGGYCSASIRDTAEHFFELGLKAKKGE